MVSSAAGGLDVPTGKDDDAFILIIQEIRNKILDLSDNETDFLFFTNNTMYVILIITTLCAG